MYNKKFNSYGVTVGAFLFAFATAFVSGSIFAGSSESDAAETRIDADATHYTTISAPDQISVNVGSASSTGTYKVQTETITTKTNSPSGYSLYLSMEGSDNKLYHSTDNTKFISSTTGTVSTPAALTTNTWGYATDSSVTSSNAAKFAAVPAKNSEVLLQKTTSANTTGTNMNVYYGALVSDALLSGTYSNTVNYTVVADATDTTTVSPASQNTLAAGTDITITF